MPAAAPDSVQQNRSPAIPLLACGLGLELGHMSHLMRGTQDGRPVSALSQAEARDKLAALGKISGRPSQLVTALRARCNSGLGLLLSRCTYLTSTPLLRSTLCIRCTCMDTQLAIPPLRLRSMFHTQAPTGAASQPVRQG